MNKTEPCVCVFTGEGLRNKWCCAMESPDKGRRWACAREAGHGGDHVACSGFRHRQHAWSWNESERTIYHIQKALGILHT